ncbi:hypothetical protein M23134_02265 [Microscilla marina ATCC 23134]|uniref:Uncharacterized protein n=1 Tax=Microscilla marina ATCC 23134 TaxID=313606 RepID=A1ZK48_MICM2|nr:hypothetical protein M23134_02265 [Microscilla marina ATCC 23134]
MLQTRLIITQKIHHLNKALLLNSKNEHYKGKEKKIKLIGQMY